MERTGHLGVEWGRMRELVPQGHVDVRSWKVHAGGVQPSANVIAREVEAVKTHERKILLLLIPAVLVLMAGCPWSPSKKENGDTPPPTLYLPQSSPASCLENLITAYVDRNIDEYLKLFPEDFTFVFSPEDITQDPSIPQQWGLAEEREFAENMFASDIVDRVELGFTQSVADTSDHEFPDTWKVGVTEVELRVHTRNEEGEYLLLKVSGGFATFYFKEYPEETASDGQPLWRIWRWEDQPLGKKRPVKAGPPV